jgi:hypothetical protein
VNDDVVPVVNPARRTARRGAAGLRSHTGRLSWLTGRSLLSERPAVAELARSASEDGAKLVVVVMRRTANEAVTGRRVELEKRAELADPARHRQDSPAASGSWASKARFRPPRRRRASSTSGGRP